MTISISCFWSFEMVVKDAISKAEVHELKNLYPLVLGISILFNWYFVSQIKKILIFDYVKLLNLIHKTIKILFFNVRKYFDVKNFYFEDEII